VLHYFEHISSVHRALILAGGIIFFWTIEGFIPLKKDNYAKWKHGGINLFFTGTTIIVNFILAFALALSSEYVTTQKIGFFNLLNLPIWINVILAVMVLDLIGAYLIHFLQHKITALWRFHIIHHTDTYVDTTTANRHHPGESVFRAIFTAIAIFIAGAPFAVVMLYQSVSALLSQFNHANINLPKWLQVSISWLIVTPNMHRVHHHYVQPYTDTNYGNIFSIWDRVFNTFAKKKNSELIFGVDTHLEIQTHNNIKHLLKLPFKKI
jgi:sterol desaturase/sphingolipid hydroxylase (fatty acid hydroxylase superfamily)